jgi:hypothetical protein
MTTDSKDRASAPDRHHHTVHSSTDPRRPSGTPSVGGISGLTDAKTVASGRHSAGGQQPAGAANAGGATPGGAVSGGSDQPELAQGREKRDPEEATRTRSS